jgi:hypothetical protein
MDIKIKTSIKNKENENENFVFIPFYINRDICTNNYSLANYSASLSTSDAV